MRTKHLAYETGCRPVNVRPPLAGQAHNLHMTGQNTALFFSPNIHCAMFKLSTFWTLVASVGMLFMLVGCDAATDVEPEEAAISHISGQTFGWQGLSISMDQGVAIPGNERLRVETEDDRHAHFRIQPSSGERMDLLFSLDAIERGDPFSIKVIGRSATGDPVVMSEILHRPSGEEGSVDLSHAVAYGQRADVTCRIGNTAPRSMIDVTSADDGTLEMGTLSDWPSSFHYIRRGDDVVIEIDYEREMEQEANLQTAHLSLNPSLVASHLNVTGQFEPQQQECSHIGFQMAGIPASTELHAVEMSLPSAIEIARAGR